MDSLMVKGDLYKVVEVRRNQDPTDVDLVRRGILITRVQAETIIAEFEGGALKKFVIDEEATEQYLKDIAEAKIVREGKAKESEIASTGVADALLAKVLGGVSPSIEAPLVDSEREELKELAAKYGIKVGRSSNDTLRKKIEEFESNQD